MTQYVNINIILVQLVINMAQNDLKFRHVLVLNVMQL